MIISYNKIKQVIFLGCFFFIGITIAQSNSPQDVFVDENGVMRWGHNEEEVKGFRG
jgi:hypothetical protein